MIYTYAVGRFAHPKPLQKQAGTETKWTIRVFPSDTFTLGLETMGNWFWLPNIRGIQLYFDVKQNQKKI